MNEMPTMASSSYVTNAVNPQQFFAPQDRRVDVLSQFVQAAQEAKAAHPNQFIQAAKEQPMSARIVKVFIADANENLPLEKRVLYSGEEKLTDLTDQELFFEVPIADILSKHNEYRKTVVDKKQAEKFGRDIFLEAARIRDLKMVVVNVATF